MILACRRNSAPLSGSLEGSNFLQGFAAGRQSVRVLRMLEKHPRIAIPNVQHPNMHSRLVTYHLHKYSHAPQESVTA